MHICKRMLAANEGQNRFGEVAGPFLAFHKDFSDYDDFRYACKKQRGLDKVFYVLDPASSALTSLVSVDGALLEEAVLVSGSCRTLSWRRSILCLSSLCWNPSFLIL